MVEMKCVTVQRNNEDWISPFNEKDMALFRHCTGDCIDIPKRLLCELNSVFAAHNVVLKLIPKNPISVVNVAWFIKGIGVAEVNYPNGFGKFNGAEELLGNLLTITQHGDTGKYYVHSSLVKELQSFKDNNGDNSALSWLIVYSNSAIELVERDV